ncbi:MAG: FMN-binding protein [Actinomycetota bacterium]|nr:FMN-binding protein [Actinomycetota bacterium]
MNGSKITNAKVTTLNETDGRSAEIDGYAIPKLDQQVITANSAHIDGVSGATFTSHAFVDAVTNGLDKLGFKA